LNITQVANKSNPALLFMPVLY